MAKKKRRVVAMPELPFHPLAATMHEGTDLTCALTCGAYVENAAGYLLEQCMIDNPVNSDN